MTGSSENGPARPAGRDSAVPLVVDVDGSLVNGDLLIEGVARMLAAAPGKLCLLPVWLAQGRAALKRRVAQTVPLPPETLVLNAAVREEITVARETGQEVWLASASDELVVAPLARSVGAAGFLASDGRVNLAGTAKAAALVDRFGAAGFDYIGNERRDLPVWKLARRRAGVGLSRRLARELRSLDAEARFLPQAGSRPADFIRALRPHQWVKNLLVFVALVAAHETRLQPYLVAAWAFAALTACTSGTYLLNDLLDLPHDRRHLRKRHRPLAAGRLPLRSAIGLALALVGGGLAMAFEVSRATGLCFLGYLAMTLAYSLSLKRKPLADVIALATLYAVRVLAGAATASIALSQWLIGFSLFVFLALAIIKRQGELRALRELGRSETHGRAYFADDLAAMGALGAASSLAAVVVLTLYIQSPEVSQRYARPEILWLFCPILLYWLGRLTLFANRGVFDDPLAFSLGDRMSWLACLSLLAVFVAAL